MLERERGYWRDVGTIDAYWQANMDLVAGRPDLRPLQPALADPHLHGAACRRRSSSSPSQSRIGMATDSLVSEGCIISGGRIDRSVLSPGVRINSFAHVEESILMDGVDVGRHARMRRAIIDKGVHIPPRHGDRLRPRRGSAAAGFHVARRASSSSRRTPIWPPRDRVFVSEGVETRQ